MPLSARSAALLLMQIRSTSRNGQRRPVLQQVVDGASDVVATRKPRLLLLAHLVKVYEKITYGVFLSA